jgi:hypothetical protein
MIENCELNGTKDDRTGEFETGWRVQIFQMSKFEMYQNMNETDSNNDQRREMWSMKLELYGMVNIGN